MNLSWLQYQKGPKSQFYLMLMLLEGEDRYVGLLSEGMSDHETALIRKNLKTLDVLNTQDKIEWFKTNIHSYKSAYREFLKSNARIDQTFTLTPMDIKEAKGQK